MSAVYSGRLWDKEVWERVLGCLSDNELAVTKEHTCTAAASDLDSLQWTPRNEGGSTVVVHHADSTY